MSRYNTRNTNIIPQFKVKHNFFRNSLLKFIRPSENSVFDCHNARGVKLLTRFRLGLSHLWEHKFKNRFQDSHNPTCSCGNDIQTLAHILLQCPHYSNERLFFLNNIRNIDTHIFDKNDLQITETLLYGDSSLDDRR